MAPLTSGGEQNAIRVRRLKYRASHRGTRELDLLLGPFAETHADAMDEAELTSFENLLEAPETVLQAWLLGHEEMPSQLDGALLARIIAFKRTTHGK